MVELGQFVPWRHSGGLRRGAIDERSSQPLNTWIHASWSVPILYLMRTHHFVQRHDRNGLDQYLARSQSNTLYFLVLPDELLPTTDGDLPTRDLGMVVVGLLYVCDPDSLGGERSGSNLGRTLAARLGRAYVGLGGVHTPHHSLDAGFITLGISSRFDQLSQREQLIRAPQN